MNVEKRARNVFPFYLMPGPSHQPLRWLGNRLRQIRGKRNIKALAKDCDLAEEKIESLESGVFGINLGLLREVVKKGYRYDFGNLLAECYEANRQVFDPKVNRPFERKFHYSISTRKDLHGRLPPSLLIGGDPESYLWAVPMRRLNHQPVVTELLELAPARKRRQAGATPDNSHDGTEVVFVIHGTVMAHVAGGGEGVNTKILKAGEYIHFVASIGHNVENHDKNTSALLLIVRVSEIPKSKD